MSWRRGVSKHSSRFSVGHVTPVDSEGRDSDGVNSGNDSDAGVFREFVQSVFARVSQREETIIFVAVRHVTPVDT